MQTLIVGVVSAHATAYLDSYRAGRASSAPVPTQLADGMACRVPEDDAPALHRDAQWGRRRRCGVALTGGNVDRSVFARVLMGA